ncbi:predicted protein [Thalassiosira pseudonana CCMP1335]|uniref:SF4 helicase domain-containing protein n=1 Tax=Thalassiosira pseudonana TaxID=35128 RepID=B8LE42_THAPS|nr:predicted protein [Thalassiosira pseudonana CCMP1335]EED86397.1 predicted protein [Thalassiosira pseudonana CCMP1335]
MLRCCSSSIRPHAVSRCLSGRTQTFRTSSTPIIVTPRSTLPNLTPPSSHQQTTHRTKVFVSRHNNTLNLAPHQITSYITQQLPHLSTDASSSDFRYTSSHVILQECPFCPKPTKGRVDNQYKLYVSVGGGAYFCHRCGAKGSWYDFKSELGGFSVEQHSNACANSDSSGQGGRQQASNSINSQPWNWNTKNNNGMNYLGSILQYLTNTRGLDRSVLRKYGVGCASYNFHSKDGSTVSGASYVSSMCVTFPCSTHGPYIPRRIKVRSIEKKAWQRLDPPGGGFGLFGWHTVPHNATEIIITEGEFDAMAVYQATGRPAVSLPNGCRSLPMEVLLLLENFDTVYLWMDNDGPGREGAEMFARKLGVERCLLVQPSGKRGAPPEPPKDANEALLTGWDINELLEEASELPHERILKFSDLRDQVIHEIINPEKYRGTPIPSLPGFTSLIKGFRRGELTVLTGPTGSGKTTFLGQTSLDLVEQGINVLWGSFEIKNTRLMHKLLQQYMKDVLPVGLAEKDLSVEERQNAMTALTSLADKFESLPMYFMKFHGGSDVDDVLDAMEYAAYVHDVEHIILDNMQFMISRQSVEGKGSSFDKFDMQDIAIEKFRKFATEYNVHVTLVVHPRKEDEGAKLGMSSFYGSAKATQEADTVLILQSDGKRKFVDVKKNRFDGTIGHSPLYFQRKSGRYSENPDIVSPPQRTMIPNGVSALNGARASASVSTYQDIRGQHPV